MDFYRYSESLIFSANFGRYQ